jgi:hypothetical protein
VRFVASSSAWPKRIRPGANGRIQGELKHLRIKVAPSIRMGDPSAVGNPSRAEADRFDLDRGLAGLGLGHPRLRLRDRRRSIPQSPFHLVLHRGRVSPGALSGRHTSNPDGSWMTQQARNFVAGLGLFRFVSSPGPGREIRSRLRRGVSIRRHRGHPHADQGAACERVQRNGWWNAATRVP